MNRQQFKRFLPILIVIGILLLAYLMRNVPVPPDCISDPANPACRP